MPDYRSTGVPGYQLPGIVPYEGTPAELELPKREDPILLVPAQHADQQQIVDTRGKFTSFIETYGQMVLIQRMNMNIHCFHCFNEKFGEPDPKCPYCLGRGYISLLERRMSRRTTAVSEHRQDIMVQSGPGPEVIDEVFWYLNWDSNPNPEDMIYEVTWSDLAMMQPKNIVTAYRVSYAWPFRGFGGRIDYWRCTATARPIDKQITDFHLHRLAPQIMQIPDDGIIRYVNYPSGAT